MLLPMQSVPQNINLFEILFESTNITKARL